MNKGWANSMLIVVWTIWLLKEPSSVRSVVELGYTIPREHEKRKIENLVEE